MCVQVLSIQKKNCFHISCVAVATGSGRLLEVNTTIALVFLGIPLTQSSHINDKTDTGTLAGKCLIITGWRKLYNNSILAALQISFSLLFNLFFFLYFHHLL